MSNYNYTPGPWSIDIYDDFIVAEGICDIACIVILPNLVETKANQNLIAAAPELLEALQASHHFLRKAGYAMTEIDKAIDKALGVTA